MTELLVNRYRIQERVGSGQQGSVYRAHDTLLDRLVALKMIQGVNDSVGLDETLRREALLLAKFEYPNVVRVYDVVTDIRGQSVIVMELLDGEPLLKCIRTLTATEVRRRVQQFCEAMQVAHQSGLLHRDLKPGNIMYEGRNTSRERFVSWTWGSENSPPAGKMGVRVLNRPVRVRARRCRWLSSNGYLPARCHKLIDLFLNCTRLRFQPLLYRFVAIGPIYTPALKKQLCLIKDITRNEFGPPSSGPSSWCFSLLLLEPSV